MNELDTIKIMFTNDEQQQAFNRIVDRFTKRIKQLEKQKPLDFEIIASAKNWETPEMLRLIIKDSTDKEWQKYIGKNIEIGAREKK